MCILYAAGVCRGSCALTHTFGCFVYTPEGIKSVRSYGKAVVGLNVGTGSRRYPRSFSVYSSDIEHFNELAYYGYL